MFYTIYRITNTINNKIYVGKHKTKKLDDNYMGSGKHLKNSISKYGIDNFKKEIMFVFDTEEEMNEKEAEIVNIEFVLREDTYNICIGGQGGWSYVNNTNIPKFKGKKHNEHSKTRMGHHGNANFLGKTHSESVKEKIGRYSRIRMIGNTHSEKTKEKISYTMTDKYGYDMNYFFQILEYSKQNNLSIRKTCNMFGLNRITYTKYYKKYAGVAQW